MFLNILESVIRRSVKLFGWRGAQTSLAHLAEHLAPVVVADAGNGRQLRFYGHGTYVPWRATRLLSKEPETIAWIDGFKDGDVFWDIGANVGVYTLYAALQPGVRVVAFEPVAATYYVLNRSISLNRMQDRVSAYCAGLSDRTAMSPLYLLDQNAGSSGHSFKSGLVENRTEYSPFKQSGVIFSIDYLIDELRIPFPNHVKIDVDGNENEVILGAAKCLKDARLKSLLVEIPTLTDAVRGTLMEAGFKPTIVGKFNQIFER